MSKTKNRKPRPYYGIAGINAYGTLKDYHEVLLAKEKIQHFNCKHCPDFESAKEWAIETFVELQEEDWMNYRIPEIKKRNKCYFRKPIVRLK